MAKKKEEKTNAMRILDRLGIVYEPKSYDCGGEFIDGLHTADSLGLPYDEVYKTLVTQGAGNEYYVFLLPMDRELDLKKAAKAAGVKSLEMLPVKEIQKVTGYIRGGCTPLGMKKQYPVFISITAKEKKAIHISAGKRGVQLALAPEDLIKAAEAEYAEIIK